MFGEKLYPHLPPLLQNVACSAYGVRERRVRVGREFRHRYHALVDSDFKDKVAIAEFQDANLARLVEHAFNHSRYYRRVMDSAGIRPQDVRSRADLVKLPILSKEFVRRHHDDIEVAATEVGSQTREVMTSGSTGTPLSFPVTYHAIATQWAVWWRHRQRFGVRPSDPHVNFTGKPIVPASQTRPPYWRYNWPMSQLVLGMQHIAEAKAPSIAAAIDRWAGTYWSGYPSVIAEFCALLQDLGIQLKHRPKAVFLGAEGANGRQIDLIREVTGATVTDQYGFSEGAGNASRCPEGNYHEDWEFGLLECGDPMVLADGSIRGRVIGTGFWNTAFPFIRYEVGDFATWAPRGYQCACGRQSRVILSIEGRLEDYVLTPDGRRITRLDYLFKGAEWAREAQVIQTGEREVLVRAIPSMEPTLADVERLERRFAEYVSSEMRVKLECQETIPRTEAGKFRAVVSLDRWRADQSG